MGRLITQEDFGRDPYYDRPEVSNSDLSWLKKQNQPAQVVGDIQAAYRFGTLLDALVTEPHKVNLLKRTVAGWQYDPAEIERAQAMRRSFYRDTFCAQLAALSDFQKVSVRPRFGFTWQGWTVFLPVRCKWDFFPRGLDLGGDLKSTTARTRKQFVDACFYFDYFRQRAFYMDLEGRNNDVLIGVSKEPPHEVFRVPITRGDQYYRHGLEDYSRLGFQYWQLFGNPAAAVRSAA